MARSRFSPIAAAVVALLAASVLAEGYGGRVGGRTEVKDVKTNEEVQQLGRFSVEEYNRRSRRGGGGSGEVEFAAVVAAERQVVSGTKYYLRILGIENGERKIFESVVIVKPWIGSKRLLDFSPSKVLRTRSLNF